MPRPPRIVEPNGTYHVVARGNARGAIYRGDPDRALYVALLDRAVRRFGWDCHAYCLMTTHVHLILELRAPNLSCGIQWLNGLYGQLFNERHGRSGHVFEGRFWSTQIESEEQLATTYRYVFVNPVAAGLADAADAWAWSGGRLAGIRASL